MSEQETDEKSDGAALVEAPIEPPNDTNSAPPPDDADYTPSEKELPDEGLPDKGLPDEGLPDEGLPDKGLPDVGLPDVGLPEAVDFIASVPTPLAEAGLVVTSHRQRSTPAPIAPCDIDAERAILTNALLQPDRFAGVLGDLTGADFFEKRHGVIFDAMRRLAIDGQPIDPITVYSELQRQGTADRSGGMPYLFQLQSHAGSGLAIEFYATRVGRLAHVRRILGGLHKAQALGMQQGLDPDAFIEMVQTTVVAELEKVTGSGSTVAISEIVEGVYDGILARRDDDNSLLGIRTGFRDVDNMLMGFHPTDLVILAARPAMGKTSLALNFAYNVANQGKVVMAFSLEMGKEQLVQRLLSHRAGVNLRKVRSGEIDESDEIDLREAAASLSEMKFYVDDTPGLSAVDVRARSKRVQLKEHKIDFIIIDYMQLMRGTGGNKQSREQEISEISRSLKGLAKELDCTVMALSQLNRNVESRPDKTPKMSDLRESGSIEQDADIICFIYRDVVYNKEADPHAAKLIVSKHRAGEIGDIPLHFDGRFTRFATSDRFDDSYVGG